MTNRVQTLRSSVAGNRPATGAQQPGSLYVNFADLQLGVVNAAQAAQDLIAVRSFSVTANYKINDCIVNNGSIYTANQAITAGTFNLSQWTPITFSGGLLVVQSAGATPYSLGTTAGAANFVLNKNGAFLAQIIGCNNNSLRWSAIFGNAVAEGSLNVGSDFSINSYDNNGVGLGMPFNITRANGFSFFNGYGATPVTPTTGSVGAAVIGMNKAAGQTSNFVSYTNGVPRWALFLGNATTETGGGTNSGSDFGINNYSDIGTALATPILIQRATGYTFFNAVGATIPALTTPGSTGNCLLGLNKAPGTVGNFFNAYNSGVIRWQMALGNSTAEGGTATGSDLVISGFNNAGTLVNNPLVITRSSGVCTFAVAIVNGPSDGTLKENIAPLEGSLEKVNALQGVSFNMIDDPFRQRQIGLIAQDVEPVVPEIIQEFQIHDEEGKAAGTKLALDYPKLTALLIEAVKTLTARIQALESKPSLTTES
jgi:hypothetical protein